jgi:uncharacterized membrane protein HdeD (DUF308 family)
LQAEGLTARIKGVRKKSTSAWIDSLSGFYETAVGVKVFLSFFHWVFAFVFAFAFAVVFVRVCGFISGFYPHSM